MTAVFVVCASVGATVLVLQFLLALAGLGGDTHDFGHDAGGIDHDLSIDCDHAEVPHAEMPHEGHGEHAAAHHAGMASRGTVLLRALSLRTVMAALAFFGLGGGAAQAAECSDFTSLVVATAAGLAAMYAVFLMLNAMRTLRAEGTARVQRALGKEASVYLRIPGQRQGRGKIQINLQNRTMEYLAVTAGGPIPTGATVVVTDVLGSEVVEVEAVAEHVRHQPVEGKAV